MFTIPLLSIPSQNQGQPVGVTILFHHSVDVSLYRLDGDAKALCSKASLTKLTQSF